MGNIFVIAEAGINHNGSLVTAKEMIDVAKESKADAVKFQAFVTEKMMTRYAQKAEYQKMMASAKESQYEMVGKHELNRNELMELSDYCTEKGILFLASPFDLNSVETLVGMGMKVLKVPSGEITNYPYLKKIGGFGKRVIMSTGMADMKEVKEAMEVLIASGTPKSNVTLLHCTSMYPTPYSDVNLQAMLTLRDVFRTKVGYSDHTQGTDVAIAAAALGADVIEKHFTMDKKMEGPDHQSSLEPDELKGMISSIRNIQDALGSGIKGPARGEAEIRLVARKSIVAARAISVGEVFSEDNITVKRPGTGMNPMKWLEVIGKVSSNNYEVDEQIIA